MFKKIVGLGFSSKGKNAKDVGDYIKSMVDSGAGEFFTGYNPSYWYEKFGFEVSPNGRFAEHEQITDYDTLKQIVDEVHKYNLEIFANLNAWYYTSETFPLIKKMIEEFIEIGVDGIICGNIDILEYLKSINYKGKVNISTILAVYNKEAIRFFLENYKINKIILSREITLKEIEEFLNEFPDVNFEVFGEGDFCRYNNGLCFAEHKYGSKDICTVVVNDLIIKKKFKADYKKIILNSYSSNLEKINDFNDNYLNLYEEILDLLQKLDLGIDDKGEINERLVNIIYNSRNRIDLFFDALKPICSEHNQNIINYLKGLNYVLTLNLDVKKDELLSLKRELDNSVKSGILYLSKKIQEIGGETKLKALEVKNFYAKSDNLNLYSYLFFSKFKNLNTVKFPTRGRNYAEKIALIEDVLKNGKVRDENIDRGISLERAHYDLTYLFGDKLWFRKIVNKI
nr:U32 family peptidase [Candidatus Gracilibacteria bacterium]